MANGEEGGRPASIPWLPYLQDLMGVYQDILGHQSLRLTGMYQRMASGDYTIDRWVGDAAQMWTGWIEDGAQFLGAWQRSAFVDDTPTMVFVVDEEAEVASEKAVRVRLAEGSQVAATPLTRMDGQKDIPVAKLTPRLTPRRDRVTLRIKNIGDLERGRYLGWIYSAGPGNEKMPVVAVHLVKL
jgi:hypothetical protein